MTALMHAAMHGHLECVKLLVDKEAGLQDREGQTALILAAKTRQLECVEFLKPFESDIKDNYGFSYTDYMKNVN